MTETTAADTSAVAETSSPVTGNASAAVIICTAAIAGTAALVSRKRK
ncbi:MAG: hypothetical protein ACI4J6_01810 [Oscillospiraceae bacterium]